MDGWIVVLLILVGFVALVAVGWWLIYGREGSGRADEP
jgi:hypothetical protein